MIRVSLIQSLRLPPNQGAMISVKLEGDIDCVKHSLLVQNWESIEKETGLTVEDAIIPPLKSGVHRLTALALHSVFQRVHVWEKQRKLR